MSTGFYNETKYSTLKYMLCQFVFALKKRFKIKAQQEKKFELKIIDYK